MVQASHRNTATYANYYELTVPARLEGEGWGWGGVGWGGVGEPVKITEGQRSGRGAGARLYCVCSSLSHWYHYMWTVKINPSRTSQANLQLRQSSQYSVKIFSRFVLVGGGEAEKLVHRCPNQLSAGL